MIIATKLTHPVAILIVYALQSVAKVVLPLVPFLRKKMHPLPKGLSIPKFTHTLSLAFLTA